jgi:hypothetical protein
MNSKQAFRIIVVTAFLLAAVTDIMANQPGRTGQIPSSGKDPASGEQINWQVISAGGTDAESDNYRLRGTIGQLAVGASQSKNFRLMHGFWQGPFRKPCELLIGDADGSGAHDIDDVVWLVMYIFQEGPPPTPCSVTSGDADCSCAVDIDDVIFLIQYLFCSGPPPCTCEEWIAACGAPCFPYGCEF